MAKSLSRNPSPPAPLPASGVSGAGSGTGSQPSPPQIHDVILDSIADGVFTVDANWRITSFNLAAEQITGVPRCHAIGQRCRDVFHASICESECALEETMATGRQIVAKPIYVIDLEGRRIPISISTAILKDHQGHIIGGVETFRDLSVVEQLRKELHEKYTFADIVGRSPAIRRLFGLLPKFADSSSTILIEGPSGTGKELFARAIHHLSPRRDKKFVPINCGALPDNLLESELFGYKAGAFTDARHDKPGQFAIADGGTILLDEIGDISPALQMKFLRVLQEREFLPLGAVDPIRIDVRIIVATNQRLDQLVKQGIFREDLYFRINVARLQLPPLRERREDIPLLVEHFISKFNRLQGKHILGVSEQVLRILIEHDYSGNVRELENIIEHAFILCSSGLIDLSHLPPELCEKFAYQTHATCGLTVRAMEAIQIVDAIHRHAGNRTAAARELGIHPSTLFRKVKSMGIELPAKDGRSQRIKYRIMQ
ncbi:MAG: sigma 54-interacting transcriptional regulator [Pirellulales bacterium]|nr:sigma 54-interacting transcriptional regulator [Pirellulales bacterium]